MDSGDSTGVVVGVAAGVDVVVIEVAIVFPSPLTFVVTAVELVSLSTTCALNAREKSGRTGSFDVTMTVLS